jgi:predicted nucleotidyltransferase
MNVPHWTPYPDVNAMLLELLRNVQHLLGSHFIGMYLDGSLANGDFDEASDIDFIVVTDEEVSATHFSALQAMHDHLATTDSRWAMELEGSYIGQHALRRFDPAHALHPNIERGPGERLKLVHHDAAWIVHRYVLRERGVTLVGPAPDMLIDPISPTLLRQAMVSFLPAWATYLRNDPAQITHRGYQSYIVLSLCRVLYTLHHGTVVSKLVAARWARESLGERWVPLIEHAWAGRRNAGEEASPEDVHETLKFLQYTIEHSEQFEKRTDEAGASKSG